MARQKAEEEAKKKTAEQAEALEAEDPRAGEASKAEEPNPEETRDEPSQANEQKDGETERPKAEDPKAEERKAQEAVNYRASNRQAQPSWDGFTDQCWSVLAAVACAGWTQPNGFGLSRAAARRRKEAMLKQARLQGPLRADGACEFDSTNALPWEQTLAM